MKLPGWIEQLDHGTVSEDGRSIQITIRVKRWHPGFWLALLRYWIVGHV
jgi:hypothetical protein